MAQGLADERQEKQSGPAGQDEIEALNKHQPGDLVTPQHAAELEQHYNVPSAEEPVYSTAGNEPSTPQGGKADKEPSRDELKKAETEPSGQNAATTKTSASKTANSEGQHENMVGSGYKQSVGNKLNQSKALRRYIVFGGVAGGLIAIMVILFSFLNVFKLDGLMSNIEQKSFLRHNASLNTRSSKWISAYVEARMLQFGDDPTKNAIFRSTRVDTNSPFTDWYRTMVTSNFEQDVFEKYGIKFVSYIDDNGRPRAGKIDINGEKPITVPLSNADIQNVLDGKPEALSKFESYLDLEKLDSNKAARQAIKKVVNDNTHWSEVYKRRFLRRSIQNMTGVKDWRFFETTRDKITDKKIDIRNRILDNILPNNGIVADVARCFYGLKKCTPSDDPGDPKTQIGSEELSASPDNPDTNSPSDSSAESKSAAALDAAGISDALKKILAQLNIAQRILNIPSTLDMLSYININLKNLTKFVVLARGAQAAGLFQVFETSRDQIKTGQVSGEEVNAFMQVIGTAGSSAAYSQVIDGGSGNKPGTTQTGGQCSQQAQALQEKQPNAYSKQYGDYAPLCADQQIGSGTNAQTIQIDYENTIGKVVTPIVSAWTTLKTSSIFGPVISLLEKFNSWIGGITNFVVSGVLNALGLQGDVQKAITWVFAKTSNFLGLTILKGYESAGTITNWLLQGGSYSAESASRQEGAALTTPGAQAAAQNAIAQYESDQQSDTSLFNKVASLDNTNSLAFKGASALSNIKSDPSGAVVASMHSFLSSFSQGLSSIFSPHLLAATPNGYAASQFAGIKTYDYPAQCYNLDPITEKPLDGTNALTIFQQHSLSPSQADIDALNSWDTERSSEKFYTTVYHVIGENNPGGDTIAEQIYNCNLLDTAVRGSLGYLYGYNADAASQVIEDAATTSGSTNPPANNPTTPISGNAQALAQQILSTPKIQLAGRLVLQDVQAAANNQPGTAGVMTSAAILQLILNVGQKNTVVVSAIQSGGTGHCNDTPKLLCPTDPHYNGDAVDFSMLNGFSLTGRDAGSLIIINIATGLLPAGSGFGQTEDPTTHVACGPQITLPSGFIQFADTCNHLHVQVPAGTK